MPRATLLLLALAAALCGQEKTLEYKPGLSLTVYQPEGWKAGQKRTGIVFFFGGGWTGGTVKQFEPHARHFAGKGAVAICADYRVKTRHNTTPFEAIADGKAAIAYVRAHAKELGIAASSAEGYLFPATYELLSDSTPSAVVSVLVGKAQERLRKLQGELSAQFARRLSEHGMSAHDVVVLASVIEKEAAREDEKPLIASVFLNRLIDPTFRPLRMLQSDPTASFGCLVQEPMPASCSPGRPTPAMLRDASNLYNTYRHPGLPPGPISSPGEAAIRAVLAPAKTDYLYFVAQGGGRHRFSRTFSEHRGAIEQSP